ncbi:hypothetical protein F3Y22_tig00017959pilonHSYRG00020 [Hibiscus syriacus]|uniref:Uncharacterized protein n=1 Tax=Hibiscus syriacus TaxID=106335 RepID=A0A6A3BYB6_HIBSY|nr:hypothetical protein F3Y22_tig00017959pilonHSYRG00020 [Hibiscus syriacus]
MLIEQGISIMKAIEDAVSQGMAAKQAAKQAELEGEKAAKLATRQAKISKGYGQAVRCLLWRFSRQTKAWEGRLSCGKSFGELVGGRIGPMAYDVVNGIIACFSLFKPKKFQSTKNLKFQGIPMYMEIQMHMNLHLMRALNHKKLKIMRLLFMKTGSL